jgi:hypothetical protein
MCVGGWISLRVVLELRRRRIGSAARHGRSAPVFRRSYPAARNAEAQFDRSTVPDKRPGGRRARPYPQPHRRRPRAR